MFAPPPRQTAKVAFSIPEQLAGAPRTSHWLHIYLRGKAVSTFIEGPSFDRDGMLWMVDMAHGRLFKAAPDGTMTIGAEYDGEPNGLKFHRDGRGFITDRKNGIVALDPATGKITTLLGDANGDRFRGVNDLVFARNGDLYFTDQGQTGLNDSTGRLYRWRADGRLDLLLDNVPSPNGLALNAAEDTLFLAVTRGNCIWRVPLTADGAVAKVGVFLQLSGGGGPDGIALDAAGNLAVCHMGLGVVWLFSAVGEPLLRIDSPLGRMTTNCAFGGPGGKQLFITESESGSILVADMPEAGLPLYSHQSL